MASKMRLAGFSRFHKKEYVFQRNPSVGTSLPFLMNALAMPMIFSSVKFSFILSEFPSPRIMKVSPSILITPR